MRAVSVFLVLCAIALANAQDTFGVNITGPVTSQQFGCMRQAGIDFVVVRCGRSIGTPDPNCAKNIIAAKAANISTVDAYLFPCFKCGNASVQVQKTIAAFENQSISHLWVTVENPKQAWGAVADNQVFFKAIIAAAQAAGANVGVYTTIFQWQQIMGDFTFGTVPLWYAHYNNLTSFADFKAFGGWTAPTLKQYEGGVILCGVQVDRNWAGTYNPTTGPSTSVTAASSTNQHSGAAASSTGKTSAHTVTSTSHNNGPTAHTSGPTSSGPHTSGPTSSGPASSGPASSGQATSGQATSGQATSGQATSGQTSSGQTDSSGYTSSVAGKYNGVNEGGRGQMDPFKNRKGGKQTIQITDEQIKKFEF